MRISLFLKSFFAKKISYLIEYQTGKKVYNILIKCEVENMVREKFSILWENSIKGVYPYPTFKIISIKKIIKKIEL